MSDGNDQQRIRDLGLAAALVSAEHRIIATECDPGGRMYFVFADTAQLQRDTKLYWSGELTVKARTYNESIKTLKNLIYGQRSV
jgi:hypothetical protein